MVAVGRRKSRASFLLTLFKVHDSKFWLFFLTFLGADRGGRRVGGLDGWRRRLAGVPTPMGRPPNWWPAFIIDANRLDLALDPIPIPPPPLTSHPPTSHPPTSQPPSSFISSTRFVDRSARLCVDFLSVCLFDAIGQLFKVLSAISSPRNRHRVLWQSLIKNKT